MDTAARIPSTLFFASEENRPHHHHRSSRRARPPARPFTHARASTTLDGTSHLTVYRRGSRRHPRVPPPRLAIDGVARLPAPSRFDAARGTLTHPTPSRDAGRGATRLERRGATRRARATRRIRGKTRYRTASSSAAAETRSRVSPDRSRVTRRLGFHEHHRVCVGFSSFPERDPERERGSKPGGRGALVSRSSSATERAPSSTLVFLFSSTLADLARRPASRRRTHATEHDG